MEEDEGEGDMKKRRAKGEDVVNRSLDSDMTYGNYDWYLIVVERNYWNDR